MKNCKRIEFKKSAEKFLRNRSRKEQVRLLAKIYKLPDGENIKKMEGYDNRYRLRVGDFRVIYEMSDEAAKPGDDSNAKVILVVLVIDIGNRGNIYK